MHDIQIVNQSREKVNVQVEIISNRGMGSTEFRSDFPTQGYTNPNKGPTEKVTAEGNIPLAKPGLYKLLVTTSTGKKEIQRIGIGPGGYPSNQWIDIVINPIGELRVNEGIM